MEKTLGGLARLVRKQHGNVGSTKIWMTKFDAPIKKTFLKGVIDLKP